jgi:hypothetical protein
LRRKDSEPKDIFISYARQDREMAKGLADLLFSEGFNVWWDGELHIGQDFENEIIERLLECRYIIVLWTQHSVKSAWVRCEAKLGATCRKLLPVKLDQCVIPKEFNNLHTITFDGWPSLLQQLYLCLFQTRHWRSPSDGYHDDRWRSFGQHFPPIDPRQIFTSERFGIWFKEETESIEKE